MTNPTVLGFSDGLLPSVNEPPQIVLSVVCAVFNGGAVISDLLRSYDLQRQSNTELVVIDGGSTDATLTIVELSGIADIIVSERDSGIYDAWNKALARCNGSHVSFIGADDLLADGSLQRLIDACLSEPPSTNIIAGFNILTRNRMPVQLLGEVFAATTLPRRMPMAHVMSAPSVAWLRQLGGFDSSFRSAGDYELLLRTSSSLIVKTIPHILAYMEDGGTSRQRWLPHMECWKARSNNGMSLWKAGLLLIKAVVGARLREMGLR
ncbi:glycosyltransferase [Roseateles sp. GG27B]